MKKFLKRKQTEKDLTKQPVNQPTHEKQDSVADEEKQRSDEIDAHLAQMASIQITDTDTKGIIWIENENDNNTTYLTKVLSNNDISQTNSNPAFTQYTWENKDLNKLYQIYFMKSPNRINKYVKDFGLPCDLVISVINNENDKDTLTKLVKAPKLLRSKWGIILKSQSSDENEDTKENEFVSESECRECFENAYNDKHPNIEDINQCYQIYSTVDDCKKLWQNLVVQCDTIL